MNSAPPIALVPCKCNHCNGEFNFDRSEFQTQDIIGNVAMGQTVTCPHCEMETATYLTVPTVQKKRNRHKPWVFIGIGTAVLALAIITLGKGGFSTLSTPRLSPSDSQFFADSFLGLMVICIGVSFYFIPTFVSRNKKNSTAIFLLNLFLGWTFIGWVVALVWANVKDE